MFGGKQLASMAAQKRLRVESSENNADEATTDHPEPSKRQKTAIEQEMEEAEEYERRKETEQRRKRPKDFHPRNSMFTILRRAAA